MKLDKLLAQFTESAITESVQFVAVPFKNVDFVLGGAYPTFEMAKKAIKKIGLTNTTWPIARFSSVIRDGDLSTNPNAKAVGQVLRVNTAGEILLDQPFFRPITNADKYQFPSGVIPFVDEPPKVVYYQLNNDSLAHPDCVSEEELYRHDGQEVTPSQDPNWKQQVCSVCGKKMEKHRQ